MKKHVLCVVGLGLMVLASGCRSYQSFPESKAASREALTLLAEQGRTIRKDDDDQYRKERFRYIEEVRGKIAEMDGVRFGLMLKKFTVSEARIVDDAMVSAYAHMQMLAQLPARLKEDGTAADEETAELLKGADEALAALGE